MIVKPRQQLAMEGEQGQEERRMPVDGSGGWLDGGGLPHRWATRRQRTSRTVLGGLE